MTVNSVFRPLDLKQGALSNAILQAAGPQLQVLLNAGNSNGAFGDVIVTEGCQLKSKFVYHAVTPSWDAAQGPAEKVASGLCLRSFVKESQSKREVVLTVSTCVFCNHSSD